MAPPSPKLTLTSGTEEVAKFCDSFEVYVKGGKIMKGINLPINVVMGILAQFVETNFYDTPLRRFIENNIPEENDNILSEDSVIKYIYHYYTSTTL